MTTEQKIECIKALYKDIGRKDFNVDFYVKEKYKIQEALEYAIEKMKE